MEDVLGEAGAADDLAGGGGTSPADLAARMGGLPKGYQPRMAAGAMARARLMGYAAEPVPTESDRERERRKKKRKQERKARKEARRRSKRR
jgi:signal recognition particle subunit SRP54